MEYQKMAQATLQLLDRVDIKGAEVPVFVEVRNWLMGMTQPQGEVRNPNPKD